MFHSSSLRTRLILAFAVIIFLTLALVGSGFVYILRDYQAQREMDRLAGLATVLQGQIRQGELSGMNRDDISDYLRRSSDELDMGLVLLSPQGVIMFDTEDRLVGRRIDLSSAARTGPIRRMRVAAFAGQDDLIFVVVTPLFATVQPAVRDRPQLALGLVTHQQSLTSAWLDMAPRLATVAAIALIVSVGVSWMLAGSIAGPLAAMTRATEEIARGRYDQEIPARGEDELARLARSFNTMAHEVSHSQRTLRDFVANVSHDLRTPLTSVQGFAQALVDGAVRGPEGAAQAGRIIFDESERMRTMVEDLLELSRIESGQTSLEIRPVNLDGLAARAQQRIAVQAAEHAVRLELDLTPTPPAAADERRVDQVLDNLLSNALRCTPAGGQITIRAQPVNSSSGRQAMLAVHNTDSYIPPEELPRIFERFYRVDRSRANNASGSGLGLAISREIAQAQGGTLTAVSDLTMGTEFRLCLPMMAVPRNGSSSVIRVESTASSS
ncbi:MAG: sensor histidine kinase [Chloroflexota bacterium]